MANEKCPACDGCGSVADTDGREPWTQWLELPLQSSGAVLMGLVKPIPCERCGGSGEVEVPDIDSKQHHASLGDTVIFVASDREGRQERAAIVTVVKADGRRDLLVAGRAGFYPEWDVPYSARNAPRTWHEKE